MPAVLHQKLSLFTSQTLELTKNGIKVVTKAPITYFETEYLFEDINTKVVRTRSFDKQLFAGVCGSALISFTCYSIDDALSVAIACSGLTLFFAIRLILSNRVSIMIQLMNGSTINVLANKPSTEILDQFLKTTFEEQKKRLVAKYGQHDPLLSIEQIEQNLLWLRNRQIIDDDELQRSREDIYGRSSSGKIGFN